MSLDSLETNFEALRGTMLTDAGFAAVPYFIEHKPDFLVVDRAFTDRAYELFSENGSGIYNDQTNPPQPEIRTLAMYMSQVCAVGLNGRMDVLAQWNDGVTRLEPHLDFDIGSTVLGYFNIRENPAMELFTLRQPQPERWDRDFLTFLAPISHRRPTTITLKHGQAAFINGAATTATEVRDGHKWRSAPASLPHAIVGDEGASRGRFMLSGTRYPNGISLTTVSAG